MDDKYQVIYADPPWNSHPYNLKQEHGGFFRLNVNRQYSTMTIEDLRTLSIDPYQVVYSDPPWKYNNDIDKLISSSASYNGESKINASKKYQGMPNEEISALPIKDIVAKDAACFMWTIDAHLPAAIEIMKSWGFTYKTIGFVWVKKTKNGNNSVLLAPWTLKSAEICILGTRGAMIQHKMANNIRQVHEALRREHSRKPDIIRDEIARMFPNGKRIELFARTAMPGWDAWGNEVEKFSGEKLSKGLW